MNYKLLSVLILCLVVDVGQRLVPLEVASKSSLPDNLVIGILAYMRGKDDDPDESGPTAPSRGTDIDGSSLRKAIRSGAS